MVYGQITKIRCARVSLSKIDREKNHLTGKEYFSLSNLFFPVRRYFPCQYFFPCQVLTFFPCQFLINSSKITTINSSPCRLNDKSNTSIVCQKILCLNFFRSKRMKLHGHESNWTAQKTKSGLRHFRTIHFDNFRPSSLTLLDRTLRHFDLSRGGRPLLV